MNILVVEDDDDVREILTEIVSSLGYHAVEAVNGAQALLQYLENDGIDIILCDLKMPHYDGLWLIEWFRSRNSKIPIIVISGFIKEYSAIKDCGANYILDKPIEEEVIKSTIELCKSVHDDKTFLEYKKMAYEYYKWLQNVKEGQGVESLLHLDESEYEESKSLEASVDQQLRGEPIENLNFTATKVFTLTGRVLHNGERQARRAPRPPRVAQ